MATPSIKTTTTTNLHLLDESFSDRYRMNGLVILCLLLLIIPAQLFFKYIISNNTEPGSDSQDLLQKTGLLSMLQKIEDTALYYTKLDNFKELFIVPHRPHKKNNLKEKFRKILYKDPETGQDIEIHVMDSKTDDDPNVKKPLKYVSKKNKSPPAKTMSKSSFKNEQSVNEISPAEEVEKYNEEFVYFAKSAVPRVDRSRYIKFKIGEIVRHIHDGYHGVVVGWDKTCKAPVWWLEKHGYSSDEAEEEDILESPHYLVLVSEIEETESSLYYLPQEHLIYETQAEVISDQLDQYFSHYSRRTKKYVPQEWMSKRYPKDSQ